MTRAEVIEDLFGEGISEDEARAIIRAGQTAVTALDPLKLRAGAPIGSSNRRTLAEAIEACSSYFIKVPLVKP